MTSVRAALQNHMTLSQLVPAGSLLREGIGIANARGVPGTAGFLALTLHERRLVLVTTQHVLTAAGAAAGARMSASDGAYMIGTAGWSRRGTVRFEGSDVHVDCGVVALDEPADVMQLADDTTGAPPRVGARVTKIGAATGATEGVVIDDAYDAQARIAGRAQPAPRQILVRSATRGQLFSAAGDSGAALRDGSGAIVGLLWGATAGGEGIACPVAPVLWVLHVRPVRLVERRSLRTRGS